MTNKAQGPSDHHLPPGPCVHAVSVASWVYIVLVLSLGIYTQNSEITENTQQRSAVQTPAQPSWRRICLGQYLV